MHKGLHIFNFRKGVNKNTVEDDIKGGAVIVIFSLTRYSPPYKESMAGTVGSGKGQVLRPVLLLVRINVGLYKKFRSFYKAFS